MKAILATVTIAAIMCIGSSISYAQSDHLKDLEVFVGDWKWQGTIQTGDQTDELSLIASYRWLKNKAFLMLTLKEAATGEVVYLGALGWDPDKKHIMSWDFNLQGTIFNYYQSKSDNGWAVKGTGRLQSGGTLDYQAEFIYKDGDKMTYTGAGTQTENGEKIPVKLAFTAERIAREEP